MTPEQEQFVKDVKDRLEDKEPMVHADPVVEFLEQIAKELKRMNDMREGELTRRRRAGQKW